VAYHVHPAQANTFVVAILFSTVAGVAVATDTPAAKYKPVFEVELTATPGSITAAYLRAYRSPTPEVAVKRWEDFLKEYAVDSVDDLTEVTLLRQAHLELMRLYYQRGKVKEADNLLRKANDAYPVYSVPEPERAEQWCRQNKYCQ